MSARHDFMDTQPVPLLQPGEACTELGFERSPAPRIPRARLGSVGRRQCWLIKHGAALTLATLVVALAGAAVMGWAR